MRKHRTGPRRPWYRHVDIIAEPPLPERNTGTTLATGPISRCCPLVPEILNSLPSSMAVELFVKAQDTSSPNVFLSKRDVNSISSNFVHSALYTISFLSFHLLFSFSFFLSLSLSLFLSFFRFRSLFLAFFYLLLLCSRLLKR